MVFLKLLTSPHIIVYEECQRGFDHADKEVAVLEDVPSADHIDLHKYPDHHPKAEDCPEVSGQTMSSKCQYPGSELTGSVDKEQNDSRNEKILKGRTFEHFRGHLEKLARWIKDHERAGNRSAQSDKDEQGGLRN